MPQRRTFRVTDVAAQSGLSRATVDRVLHGRAGVRPETVAQVEPAVAELEQQRAQVHLSTRPVLLDLVMQAPQRFAAASRSALEAELPALRPAVVRARFHLSEHGDPDAAAGVLARVATRGSDGVVLKAPDDPVVRAAVERLHRAGIPVVTFVTDLSDSRRTAYVGMDDRAAGATAAYLVSRLAGGEGGVLVTASHSTFLGEEERQRGFATTLASLSPRRTLHPVTDTDGLDRSMLAAVRTALREHPEVDAVYSVGGGNRATLAAFDEVGRRPAVFVAHDLDADNRVLLRTRQVSVVLHHDLRADLRRACRLLMQASGLLSGVPTTHPSQVQVVTPFNEPAALRDE